jgi:diaminopimelate epimerase
MNGAGNDFVAVDNRDGSLSLSKEQIARICDRHRGVGADGFLAVEPAQAGADFRMRYYNADGGEAEMCGNGARCFARFANRLVGGVFQQMTFETPAGIISAEFEGENVRIGLSEPFNLVMGAELDVAGESMVVHSVNTGVPHAVVVVDDIAEIDIIKVGAALRYHTQFAPAGTNANVMQVIAPGHLAIRTYERGVEGETLACGTGMVANAIVHHELTGQPSPIAVDVAGGDRLEVGFTKTEAGYKDVTLFGPADFTFGGSVEL